MPKGKRGYKFTAPELEILAEAIEKIVPISATNWDKVWEEHNERFPDLNRTSDSLKCKYQEMARTKIPTGDPNCLPHVRIAKRAYYRIVKALDGSTGAGSNDIDDEDAEGADEEGEGDGESSSDEDSRAVQEDIVIIDHRDEGGGTSLGVDPMNLFGDLGKDDSFGNDGGADDLLAAVSATASTAASTSVASTSAASARGGTKLSSSASTESTKKKIRALTMPLRIPRKSPSNSSNGDGEGDGGRLEI
jgi:hypothetical protein